MLTALEDRVRVTVQVTPSHVVRRTTGTRSASSAEERQARVLEQLARLGEANAQLLTDVLNMAPSTVRATLKQLVEAGKVARTTTAPRSPHQTYRITSDDPAR